MSLVARGESVYPIFPISEIGSVIERASWLMYTKEHTTAPAASLFTGYRAKHLEIRSISLIAPLERYQRW